MRRSGTTPPTAPQLPELRRSWTVPADLQQIARIRHETTRWLTEHAGVTGDVVADHELVVSELVANAIVHGRSPIRLTVAVTGTAVEGSVTDHGPGRPTLARTFGEEEAERGRGLMIVDALAEWGCRPADHGPGKSVWFRIPFAAA